MSPAVSFVVPTLNRLGMVERAVQSCLDSLSQAGVEGEVVVLDSESDDGSWESLQNRFASDPRVKLIQNRRGLGPTRSWLDGAEAISGTMATFLWSDDYVAPEFVATLRPAIAGGATLALGTGALRQADDTSPLPSAGGSGRYPARRLLLDYLLIRNPPHAAYSVSPACALFSRSGFDRWCRRIESLCCATPLRREIMWRRAIGPDTLLFMLALADAIDGEVALFDRPVAQFSLHQGSITVGSSSWLLTLGYWLARVAFLSDLEAAAALSRRDRTAALGEVLTQGLILSLRTPAQIPGFSSRREARRAIFGELAGLRPVWDGAAPAVRAGARRLARRLRA